jgi:hypothetical protein
LDAAANRRHGNGRRVLDAEVVLAERMLHSGATVRAVMAATRMSESHVRRIKHGERQTKDRRFPAP